MVGLVSDQATSCGYRRTAIATAAEPNETGGYAFWRGAA
jgi:hypothetical protein